MSVKVWLYKVLLVMGQMRTAVVLLGLCALASMAGTLVVQGLPIQDYVAEYGVLWARVLWYTGLTDVFRAWWFVGILVFLLASVSVCVVRNGPQIAKALRAPRHVPRLQGQGLTLAESRLREVGFGPVGVVDGVAVWQRGALNRVGYFLVHIGVLGVAAAGIVSGFMGWRGTFNLREGEADKVALVWRGADASPRFLPFEVANDGFEIEFYPSGMPSRYATNLRFAGAGVSQSEVVEVNKPVRVGAYAFYQASFGDGGSKIAGRGLDLSSGALVPFEGHVYEKASLPDGTRVELLDFRPFTVETFAGARPTDVGPSVDYVVQPPDAEAVQLRAYLHHRNVVGVADGQQIGGANDGVVIYRPVAIGLADYQVIGLSEDVWWRMVAEVAAGKDFKAVAGAELARISDEKARVEAGLALLQSAKLVKELRLTHLVLLEDFELKRYTGLQVAYDPGANAFWLASCLLILGVMLMLGRKFSRVYFKEGKGWVVSPQGVRVVREVEDELRTGRK